ncbi:MAG: extracellular solute-binding protein [Clostridia bacterium]|nr:extracellular solute-binding protein [Clostridia bacterium]
MKKKIFALLCAGMMLLSGCGGNGGNGGTDYETSQANFKGYPMEGAPKMTYWLAMSSNMSLVASNPGETAFAKELAKRTGVEIEYIDPGTAGEQDLKNRIASKEMPDMVTYTWGSFNGGASKSIEDGIILPLNDLIEEHAPNLKKYLEEHPEIDKMVKTDDGTYYCFPFIRGGERLLISTGPVYRRDWANEAGLDAPKTVADIEEILKAYKEQGVKKPLSVTAGNLTVFMGNFSTGIGFYLDSKENVVFGPTTDNYKFALETFAKWYKEGLLDNNFISIDAATVKAQVLNGETGMTIASGGGNLGSWLDTKEALGEPFDMVGFGFTANKKGGKNTYHQLESNVPGYGCVAITTSCKDPVAAVRYLDYGYSEEGHLLYNFGIEGVSYEKNDKGECIFTDLINKNPDGWTQASAMAYYLRSSSSGPFIQDEGYIDQFYGKPNQQDSLDAWIADYDTAKKYVLPNIAKTNDENVEYSEIMFDVNEYVSAERIKFITGERSFDEWDEYVKKVNELGAIRAKEIVDAALDRYNAK